MAKKEELDEIYWGIFQTLCIVWNVFLLWSATVEWINCQDDGCTANEKASKTGAKISKSLLWHTYERQVVSLTEKWQFIICTVELSVFPLHYLSPLFCDNLWLWFEVKMSHSSRNSLSPEKQTLEFFFIRPSRSSKIYDFFTHWTIQSRLWMEKSKTLGSNQIWRKDWLTNVFYGQNIHKGISVWVVNLGSWKKKSLHCRLAWKQ